MKKAFLIFLCLVLVSSLCACSGGEPQEGERIPPGFTVIENQMKMTKYSEKGSSASFSKQDFLDFLGEEFEYIVVNALPESGNLLCNGKAVLKGQTIPADQLDYLRYVPDGDSAYGAFGFSGDAVSHRSKDILCEIVFKQGENSPPMAEDGITETVEGISCHGSLGITEPNGDKYSINIITYPKNGFFVLHEDGNFTYTPKSGFSGQDRVVYSATDCFGKASENGTHILRVGENKSGIIFEDMAENDCHIFAHRMCEKNIMVYRAENGKYYFDPHSEVSKMDFLVMLMCATELDKDITAVADSIIDDDTGLSSGLKGYISAAYEKGLLDLKEGKFAPKEAVTCASAAYMVASALKLPGVVDAAASDKEDALMTMVMKAGLFWEDMERDAALTKSDAAKLLCAVEDYMKDNNIQNN